MPKTKSKQPKKVKYTLKEKYSFYKTMAETGVDKNGKKLSSLARTGAAVRANSIHKRMCKMKNKLGCECK